MVARMFYFDKGIMACCYGGQKVKGKKQKAEGRGQRAGGQHGSTGSPQVLRATRFSGCVLTA